MSSREKEDNWYTCKWDNGTSSLVSSEEIEITDRGRDLAITELQACNSSWANKATGKFCSAEPQRQKFFTPKFSSKNFLYRIIARVEFPKACS